MNELSIVELASLEQARNGSLRVAVEKHWPHFICGQTGTDKDVQKFLLLQAIEHGEIKLREIGA